MMNSANHLPSAIVRNISSPGVAVSHSKPRSPTECPLAPRSKINNQQRRVESSSFILHTYSSGQLNRQRVDHALSHRTEAFRVGLRMEGHHDEDFLAGVPIKYRIVGVEKDVIPHGFIG
jgi:hypothetical protein